MYGRHAKALLCVLLFSSPIAAVAQQKNGLPASDTSRLVSDKQYYLLDVLRERLQYPDLRRRVIELANKYRVTRVLIEDASSGMAPIQDLERVKDRGEWWIEKIVPEADKRGRAEAQSIAVSGGLVHLPKDAPWLREFRREIRDFPRGHDDQVDV